MENSNVDDVRGLDDEMLRGELHEMLLNIGRHRRHIMRMRAEIREKSETVQKMLDRRREVISELVGRGFKVNRAGGVSGGVK